MNLCNTVQLIICIQHKNQLRGSALIPLQRGCGTFIFLTVSFLKSFHLIVSNLKCDCSKEFCIHGSVHHNCMLIKSNKMQLYAGIYLLQNHSTCFGCPSHPSSGVHKTVTAASGTCHSIWATTFLQHGL